MKIIKLKYKYILSGFPSINGKFKINEFELKEKIVNQNIIDIDNADNVIYVGHFIHGFVFSNEKNEPSFNCLENNDFIKYEVSNKCILAKDKLDKLMNKYPDILSKSNKLVKEMRLTLNIPVSIFTQIVEVYTEEEVLVGKYVHFSGGCFWNRTSYIDSKELSNNSRFHINYEHFIDINLDRYQRALLFFTESFDSEIKEIRFILLISCLESLFNYNLKKEESINEKVSTIVASILSTFDGNYQYYYRIVKKFYDKRSRYLHGDNNTILDEDERELRKISRIILLFVSYVIKNNSFSIKEMIKYLESNKQYYIQDKLFLRAILAKSFNEQQVGLLDIIKELGFEVSNEVEEKILSKVS